MRRSAVGSEGRDRSEVQLRTARVSARACERHKDAYTAAAAVREEMGVAGVASALVEVVVSTLLSVRSVHSDTSMSLSV